MTKTIVSVLFSFLLLSCRMTEKETTNHPDITEMEKKPIGNLLALYPKPMTVVGAEVKGLSGQTPLNPANRINNFIQ